jgi:DNA sulfur modification protein DndD
MPESIQITEIEIENYRQYAGNQTINFPSRDKGFSVIIGENGAGKSNILNAINWCFYKKEPHQDKNQGKYIINQQYLKSLEIGKSGTMSVKIKIKIDEVEYHISRVLTVTRGEFQHEQRTDGPVMEIEIIEGYLLPKGTEIQQSNTGFEILKKEKNQSTYLPLAGQSSITKMNSILPEVLSPYFLLDGEYLEKFWQDLSRVKIGVEQISQLHLLDRASKHVSDFKTDVPKIGSSKIDSLTIEINNAEFWLKSFDNEGKEAWSREMRYNYDQAIHKDEHYHLSGFPRIEELKQDISRMEERLTDIAEEFSNSNIQIVKKLSTEETELRDQLDNLQPELNLALKNYMDTQINNGPIVMLLKPLQNLEQKVEKLTKKGDLPYTAKMRFTTERLQMNECICHADLTSKLDSGNNETNEARKNVEEFKNQMITDQGLDYTLEMRDDFKNLILKDPDKFNESRFTEIEKKYLDVKKRVKDITTKLGDTRTQLQTVGNDGGKIKDLQADHKYVLQTMREANESINDIEKEIKRKQEIITTKRIERNKEMNKDNRAKKLAFEQSIWVRISDIMDEALSKVKEKIRLDVQDKTFENFNNTSFKERGDSRFTIDENYLAELIDSDNLSSLNSLSAGEKLFLALSFISALKEITGYKFPLVIDTPLGRVSARPRYLLSQSLPKYLPGEQILFLATNTEFEAPLVDSDKNDPEQQKGFPEMPFGQLLENAGVKLNYHKITHSIDKHTATIHDYHPAWEKNNE